MGIDPGASVRRAGPDRTSQDRQSMLRFRWLTAGLLLTLVSCAGSLDYVPPGDAQPRALGKFRFSHLRGVPSAEINSSVWIRETNGRWKLVYESKDDPLRIQAVAIPASAMEVRMELEYVWWVRRFESRTRYVNGMWQSQPGWVDRERRAGCRSEIRLNAKEGQSYLMDYTTLGPEGKCQIIAYRQTFPEKGQFTLEQVQHSHFQEPTLYYPPMEWGVFEF